MFANDAENEASNAPDTEAASSDAAPAAKSDAPADAKSDALADAKSDAPADAKPAAPAVAKADAPDAATPDEGKATKSEAGVNDGQGDTAEPRGDGSGPAAESGEGGPAPEGKRRRSRRRGRDRGDRDANAGEGGGESDAKSPGGGGEGKPARSGRQERGGRDRRAPEDAPRDAQAITDFLSNDRYPLLNQVAERLGRDWGSRPPWVKSRLTTQQIRKCYGEVQRLKLASRFDASAATRLLLIKPHVAYLARRYHVEDLYEFSRVLRHCVDTVGNDATRFARFTTFFDALLAYFRAHGGK